MNVLHPRNNVFTASELIKIYSHMLFIRKFEEKCLQAYRYGLIAGFCHPCIGQEAIPVVIKHTIKDVDSVVTSYRCHGLAIECGIDPRIVMAELFGKGTGSSKGKGGSMHIFDLKKNFYGGHGIVGAHIPIGTGIAFTNKYKQNNGICITLFGEGASNQGQFFEAMNIAKLQNLPVLYIIENNLYGIGTSVERSCAAPEKLFEKGYPFNIPGKKIDGMDAFTLKTELKKAIDYTRKNGPMLLEVATYRYKGHSMSDPDKHREKEEITSWMKKDSINNIGKYMVEHNIVTLEKLDEIDINVSKKVKECYDFAEKSKEPDIKELYTDVLS